MKKLVLTTAAVASMTLAASTAASDAAKCQVEKSACALTALFGYCKTPHCK